MPLKYGGLVITKSNVWLVRHVVISAFINSADLLFSLKFLSATSNISCDTSIAVISIFGMRDIRQSATPPVPVPTSKTVFGVPLAKAATHTVSDVGLYPLGVILTRPPIIVKTSCFSDMPI